MQCRSPSSSSLKNFHSMIHSVQDFHRIKDKNMRNRKGSGSCCFSCRSFACRCLASLSRSHIFVILMGRGKCNLQTVQTHFISERERVAVAVRYNNSLKQMEVFSPLFLVSVQLINIRIFFRMSLQQKYRGKF